MYICFIISMFFVCFSYSESSINFVNATNNSDDGVYCDSGNFNASSICFKNVTNQQAYYIFLVSRDHVCYNNSTFCVLFKNSL